MSKLTVNDKLENLIVYARVASRQVSNGLSETTIKRYSQDIKDAIKTVTLGNLKSIINTDLTIYDMRKNHFYENVCIDSETFERLKDFKVISIRDSSSCTHVDRGIVISIR